LAKNLKANNIVKIQQATLTLMKIDVYIDPLDVMTPLSYSQLTECKGGTFLKKKYFVDQLSVG
jgi:hypothetical protein